MEQVLTFDKLPEAVTKLTKEVSELKRLLIEKQEQPPTDQPVKFIDVDELSQLIHLSKPTIYTKNSKNELPGVCKRGKRLYFQKDVIIEWIKEGRKKSNAEIEQEAKAYLLNNKKGLNNGK
jgi:predicted DNA-binding transcriptional regulator AlpA